MTLAGIVVLETGTAQPIGAAVAAVLPAESQEDAHQLLGLGSAAKLDAAAIATADQGAKGQAAFERPHWEDAGLLAVDGDSELPAVGARNLLRLPAPYAPVGSATQSISNSTTATAIATLTIPAGKLGSDGQRFEFRHLGRYLNNTGAVAGFTLEILVGTTVVWTGTTAPTHVNSASNSRLLTLKVWLDRRSATTADLTGHIALSIAATGLGDLISSDSRSVTLAADDLVTVDFAAELTLSVRLTLSSAATTHTYTALRTSGYCDRNDTVAAVEPPPSSLVTYDYLEDFPEYSPSRTQVTRLAGVTAAPVLITGSIKNFSVSAPQLSLFHRTSSKTFTTAETLIAASQALDSLQSHFRVWSPVALQSYNDDPGETTSGMSFTVLGPVTTLAGQIFPGHILYRGGRATLTADATATATALTVSNPSTLASGGYAILRPSTSWDTAELVYVSAVNTQTGALTVTRAFRSTGRTHASGEILQMVQLMAGTSAQGFGMNLSMDCPLDDGGTGQRLNQRLATFMVERALTDGFGDALSCHVDGILFDSDFFYLDQLGSIENADTNGEGVATHGYDLTTGENVWGLGLANLAQNLRDGLDAADLEDIQVSTGDIKALNQAVNAGCQIEGFGFVYAEDESGVADRSFFHRDFSALKILLSDSTIGPNAWDMQLKDGIAAYPAAAPNAQTSNSGFRVGFCTAMLIGAGIGLQNSSRYPWKWMDWYSVNTTPGADYGKAAAHDDIDALRAGRLWMGEPLAAAYRIYGEAFAPENSLITNGDFDTNVTGWSGTRAALVRSTAAFVTGTHALQVTPTLPLTTHQPSGAWVTGPTVALTSGEDYTLCFSIRSERQRIIQPRMTSSLVSKGLFIPGGNKWSKQVWCFRAPANSNETFRLQCGGIGGAFHLDQVRLFRGTADVFRRDYENAIVVLNATPTARTIDLDGTFMRIIGTGQDASDDGAVLTQITLPAWDGAVLLRMPA